MLYREPGTNRPSGIRRAIQRFAASVGRARRRRMAELDLLSMNQNLRQDLGLCDVDFAELARHK